MYSIYIMDNCNILCSYCNSWWSYKKDYNEIKHFKLLLFLYFAVWTIQLNYDYKLQMVQTVLKLRKFCPIIGLCSVALILLSNRSIIQNLYSDYEYNSEYKHILTWTPDSGNVKLMGWSYPDLNGFKQAGCPEYRCFLTNNRSHLGKLKFYSLAWKISPKHLYNSVFLSR